MADNEIIQAYENGRATGVKELAEKLERRAETSEDGTQWVSVKQIGKTVAEYLGGNTNE